MFWKYEKLFLKNLFNLKNIAENGIKKLFYYHHWIWRQRITLEFENRIFKWILMQANWGSVQFNCELTTQLN